MATWGREKGERRKEQREEKESGKERGSVEVTGDILYLKPQVEASIHGRHVRLLTTFPSSELFFNVIGRLDQLTCQLTCCNL